MSDLLHKKLTILKGIGPARAEKFAASGLFSLYDLLRFYPRQYLDYSKEKPLSELVDGEFAAVRALNIGIPKTVRLKNGVVLTTANVECADGKLIATWFNQPYIGASIPKKLPVFVMGKVSLKKGMRIISPIFVTELPGIVPIYANIKGVDQKTIRNAIKQALSICLGQIDEQICKPIRVKFNLPNVEFAYRNIHFPQTTSDLACAKYRLSFEETLKFTLILEMARCSRIAGIGISFDTKNKKEEFLKILPFTPTSAQLKVMDEIVFDMSQNTSMNRLVQGDVGSGKTILAVFAMFIAAQNGYQSVLMAPTEILAEQHFTFLKSLFPNHVACITSAMTTKQRENVFEDIKEKRIMFVTGTHALIENKVEFSNLGLVVTDEQHRFGVKQRAMLSAKSTHPDVIIMSATPIPRTLSLLLYGDLDLSVVDELPPGRKPVVTKFVPHSKRIDMYRYIEKTIKSERIQAYVVCPMIEENDDLPSTRSAETVFRELSLNLNLRIALMHGKLKNTEKETIMNSFRKGEIDVLVSTTVIEVGVDVPNACIIVIESAERFGLAQLHQLRGRVGRGKKESYCYLLSESNSGASKERLKILINSNDGFEIAEKDLKLRGPGEFMGTKQSGVASLLPLSLLGDMETMTKARDAASEIINSYSAESEKLIAYAKHQYEFISKNIAIN